MPRIRTTLASNNGTYAPLAETVHTVAAASTAQTIDLTTGTIHDLTLTAASCAITLPTPVLGRSFLTWFTQDGTGGRLVTYVGQYVFPGGASPTLTTTPGALDGVSWVAKSISGVAKWVGLPVGYDIR